MTPKATIVACQAARFLSRADRPLVSPRKSGTVPAGSIITNRVTKTSQKNLTRSIFHDRGRFGTHRVPFWPRSWSRLEEAPAGVGGRGLAADAVTGQGAVI